MLVLAGDDPAGHASPARLKLVSLELAVLTIEPDTLTDGLVGTPRYMSPEMVRDQRATFASDVFALGCMLVEALTGESPWHHDQVMDVVQEIPRPSGGDREPIPRLLHHPPHARTADLHFTIRFSPECDAALT